ncbi:hypothetical protein C408_0095 [Vibrio diabolicus E0666]|nr:hypothetical protein C408_0095 [Vibrio diabolicus E0666]
MSAMVSEWVPLLFDDFVIFIPIFPIDTKDYFFLFMYLH